MAGNDLSDGITDLVAMIYLRNWSAVDTETTVKRPNFIPTFGRSDPRFRKNKYNRVFDGLFLAEPVASVPSINFYTQKGLSHNGRVVGL